MSWNPSPPSSGCMAWGSLATSEPVFISTAELRLLPRSYDTVHRHGRGKERVCLCAECMSES